MRRACLNAIGLLDEKHFGRGYGEENDWCQRAMKAGWANAIAADVFVRHHGGTSFGAETATRVAAALRTMARLHPSYEAQVQAHIAADPLWEARARLDLARLALHRRERNALLVCHDRGGGTERHLMEQAVALQARDWGVFEMRPSKKPGAVSINHPRLIGLHAATAVPVARRDFLVEALRTLRITSIELHQTVDFPDALPELLLSARDALGIELHATLHDYRSICPRIHLARPNGRYCGEPDAAGCNTCLAADGLRATSGDIASWRRKHLSVLERADGVRVPDEDVALRLKRYLPGVAAQVCPHDDHTAAARPRHTPVVRGERPTQIMVLGAISNVKGYDVVLQCARTARRLGLPVEFALLGYSMDDASLATAGVRLLGRYDDAEVHGLIADNEPDLVFLPSTCPETYCYTLSTALRSGRPVVVFDIGAQARRLRSLAAPPSRALPLALIENPDRLVRRLLAIAGHPMERDRTRAVTPHERPSSPTLH
jgi:glycosyltransferase involved in cell wall biosynthesis